MEIRKLTEADAGPWWRLRLEALETDPLAFGNTVEEHRQTTVEALAGWMRQMGKGSFTLGGFDGDSMIAMATLMRESAEKERHKGHLRRVYVAVASRGRGLGAELIRSLIALARQDTTLEQIQLAVGAHNTAALATYRKFGFEVYGTEPHALKVGPEYVDEHLMVLQLRG